MMMWPFPDDGSFPPRSRRSHTDDPDVRLTYDVAEALTADDRTRRQRITVEVQNRVVLLGGAVDSPQTADVAVAVARNVIGVRDVCDGLRPRTRTAPTDDAGPLASAGRSERQAFEEIVADLAAPVPSQDSRDRTGSRPDGVVVVLLTSLCLLLGVLMAILGWLGVLIACAVGVVAVERLQSRRRRPPRGEPRPS